MGWVLTYHGTWKGYVSVYEIASMFDLGYRTVLDWICQGANNPKMTLRMRYQPNRAKGKRAVVHPLVYIHVDDLIKLARIRRIEIPEELRDELRRRYDASA